jgi:UDP-N-acetylmuramyl pentapeptide phosphotransferase/UDP-N-acetylglucosamine-1-phosphate transferase
VKRLLLAGLGAAAAHYALRAFSRPELERQNFRGRTVTLAGGPALATSASVTGALGARSVREGAAVLTAGLGSGAVGLYDDIVGGRPEQKAYKGFKGHLRGLRDGKITGGLAKIAGVGASALVASYLLGSKRGRARTGAIDVVLGAGVIAGSANLVNLLDLRPGRALKAGLLVGGPLSLSRKGTALVGPLAAAGALLPQDLGEEIMLGDTGANALGAVIGVNLAARSGRFGRASFLAVLTALTLASEKVSFTQVIEKTPGLREIDGWGRRT